ncbi:MAG: thiolase family protein [Myxococcaceae bacterium]
MAREVVIVGAARTPIGSFEGAFSSLAAPQLGAVAIQAALARSGVSAAHVEELWMGNALQAGVGQAPARQAALGAGLPEGVACTTLNKACGSGLKAVVSAAQAIALGDVEVAIAGGMESMTNAPYLSHATRGGARMGHVDFKDAMIHDGLWDPYSQQHMGSCAEVCAETRKISREMQDEYSRESVRRAVDAQRRGAFKEEIAPVTVPQKRGEAIVVSEDERPKAAKIDKIATLKPVFKRDGTVTAGNSSSINDGAAAVVLMTRERAKAEGRTVLGRIVGHAVAARKPLEFTIAPADAMQRLLERTRCKVDDVDFWEINEAFAVVAIANSQILKLDPARVNPRGGAVGLGHPIGASGARLLVTLLQALKDENKRRGVVSLCIGGGEGIALMVDREGA